MELVKKSYRISASTAEMLKTIVEKENCTEVSAVENAIRYYKDYLYMQTDGALLRIQKPPTAPARKLSAPLKSNLERKIVLSLFCAPMG